MCRCLEAASRPSFYTPKPPLSPTGHYEGKPLSGEPDFTLIIGKVPVPLTLRHFTGKSQPEAPYC